MLENIDFLQVELHYLAAQLLKEKDRHYKRKSTINQMPPIKLRSVFKAIRFNFIYSFVERNRK